MDSPKIRIAALLGAFLAAALLIAALGPGLGHGGVPSDVVAVVDGKAIPKADFDRALRQAAARNGVNGVPAPGDPQYEQLSQEALGGLLDIAWIQGEAAERGVEASDREVAQELQTTIDQNFNSRAKYEKFISDSGFTDEDIDVLLRLRILSMKIEMQIAEASSPVPSRDISRFYEANKALFAGRPLAEVSPQISQQLSGQIQQQRTAEFLSDYMEKWIERTVCGDPYLLDRCVNFEATAPTPCPDPSLPAQEQSTQLATVGCPPPVLSAGAAAPGSFRPFALPTGFPPQRPHPAGAGVPPTPTPAGLPGAIPPQGAAPGAVAP